LTRSPESLIADAKRRNSGLDAGIQTLRTAIPRIFGSPQNSALAAIITPSPTPAVSTATPFFSRPYFHIAGVTVAAVAARELKYVGVCTVSIRAAVCRIWRKIRAWHRKQLRNSASFSAIICPRRPPNPSNKMNASQLDKRFAKHRRAFGDDLNRVYVNGDHTPNALQKPSDKWKAVTTEPVFRRLMFSGAE